MKQDGSMVDCITPRIDCEDAGSLILFIDHFLPMLDVSDPDSKDTAMNVFRVREKIHQALGRHGTDIPAGKSPV